MSKYDKMTKQQLIERVRELEEIASNPFEGIIKFKVNVIDDYAMDQLMQEMTEYITDKWEFGCFETFTRKVALK